jgi:membrane-bound lytic murein transglycosylase A
VAGAPRITRFARLLGLAACALLPTAIQADARAARPHQHKAHHAPAPAEEFTGKPNPPGPIRFPDSRIEPVAWSNVEGWTGDDHAAALTTFLASCRALVGSAKSSRDTRPVYPALVDVCRHLRAAPPLDDAAARKFFETNFAPVNISKIEDTNGLLTGYYEPVVDGSRFPTGEFKVPLYRRPPDIVNMSRKRKADGFPNRGRVMRRINRLKYEPYYDRAAIEDGALDGKHLEITYLKDFNDLLFMQIQGSARVRLEDGLVLRVNYDAHNGHPYTPVGRVLIERNLVPREEMSMQRIRQWMADNPGGAAELRRQNKSYVFFRITGLSGDEEPKGAQGVPLTPSRSIAVDRALHVYGTPFFIQAELPIDTEKSDTKFRRLMIAQDTGSAIVGPARADIYFGAGADAGHIAGRVKNPARFVMLMPRALDPVEAGKAMPLPVARPASAPPPQPLDKPAVTAAPALPEKPDRPEQPAAKPALQTSVPLPPDKPLAGPIPLPSERPADAPAAQPPEKPAAAKAEVPLPPDKPLASPVPLPQPRPKP